MRTGSYIAVSATAVTLGLYQTSLLGALPSWFVYIQPVLSIVVLFFLLKRPQAGYLLAGISGVVSDLISATPTGFSTARLLLTALVIDFAADFIITNRSVYGAAILIVIARLSEYLFLGVAYYFYIFILERELLLQDVATYAIILGMDLVLITGLFLSTSIFTKRFLTIIPFVKSKYG
ncbi:hypothetical protein GF391_02240 [Candidatus Uhrbacteria bacterium]|nr:hypothetical protein [Candidatus Uhrbacteria bacterium]